MAQSKNKSISILILAILAVIFYLIEGKFDDTGESLPDDTRNPRTSHSDSDKTLKSYYDKKVSGKMITVSAAVDKVLSDDLHPPRHQRFVIRLSNGLTVLVAHNIDLAPRVQNIQTGEQVKITGQYEWNAKGGVIHWTHHDPKGHRDGGQISYKGKVYR